MTDPFAELGLGSDATADDVRRARRDLAKHLHPDAGGDPARMQRVNAAAAAALRSIAAGPGRGTGSGRDAEGTGSARDATDPPAPAAAGGATSDPEPDGRRIDAPSFTVEALPVETFEGLLLAGAVLGEIVDDDPPYEMTVLLGRPLECWCRLSVVPDAGASTVSIAVAPSDPSAGAPALDAVRDAWIAELNRLDWDRL